MIGGENAQQPLLWLSVRFATTALCVRVRTQFANCTGENIRGGGAVVSSPSRRRAAHDTRSERQQHLKSRQRLHRCNTKGR
eukprot:scaffold13318_cov193-Alexandrium_tamarense.AAC.2